MKHLTTFTLTALVLLASCAKQTPVANVINEPEPLSVSAPDVLKIDVTIPVSFPHITCTGETIQFTGTLTVTANIIVGKTLVFNERLSSNLVGVSTTGQVYKAANQYQFSAVINDKNFHERWTVNDRYIGGSGGILKYTIVTTPNGVTVENIVASCN